MKMSDRRHDAATEAAASDLEEIRALLSDFAWFADRGDGESLSRLFLPEACLQVGGQEHVGRQQIGDDCERRAAVRGRRTRHLWTNLRVLRNEGGQLATALLQMTFEQVEQAEQTTQELRVNDVFDTFERDAQGRWRFASRRIERAMGIAL
jgi:uncharacterized protein (TIGR02246 family)